MVAQSGFRNGEYQVPFLLTGWGWPSKSNGTETERWWNMKISNLPQKKTWENGKPSLCYCQLCQTRSSRCLRRNRTWEALVRHWQWANHHPQLSGRKSTSPTSAELVTLQGHGAHGSWIGCESWIKDAFEISLTYNSFHNKTIFSGKTPHILKNHVCPWIPCGSLRPPTGSPGIHGPVGLVGRVGADWRAYQKSPKG